jgi:large subunit ribosomal protein L3
MNPRLSVITRSFSKTFRKVQFNDPSIPPTVRSGPPPPASVTLNTLETDNWRQYFSRRVGLLATKLGSTHFYDEHSKMRHATVLELVGPQSVLAVRQLQTGDHLPYEQTRQETPFDTLVTVAAGERKLKRTPVPVLGQAAAAGLDFAPRHVVSFRTSADMAPEVGTELNGAHFIPGQALDIVGTSKGKGFAGGMKRWGFSGLGASHGVSVSHRAIGATGGHQDPGRVWKGKHMPGHMGARRRTVRNLSLYRVILADPEDGHNDLLVVVGAVPGPRGSLVHVKDAKFKPLPRAPPVPTALTPEQREEAARFTALFREPIKTNAST